MSFACRLRFSSKCKRGPFLFFLIQLSLYKLFRIRGSFTPNSHDQSDSIIYKQFSKNLININVKWFNNVTPLTWWPQLPKYFFHQGILLIDCFSTLPFRFLYKSGSIYWDCVNNGWLERDFNVRSSNKFDSSAAIIRFRRRVNLRMALCVHTHRFPGCVVVYIDPLAAAPHTFGGSQLTII